MCNLRMDHLSLPVAYIYGITSIFGAGFAIFGNTVVLRILWMPGQKSKSNKILTSLAISDLLVGIILLPLYIGQLLSFELLQNCVVDYTREYITTVTIGSSLLALGVVSYDRYILMTSLSKYDEIMNNKRIAIMISLSWFVPAVSPALRFIGKGPFLYFVILLTFCPLVILSLTYYQIMRVIHTSSSRVAAYNDGTNKYKKNNQNDGDKENRKQNLQKKRSEKRAMKFAKAVSVLIVTYGICLLPSCVWSITDLINESRQFTDTMVIQNLYVLACFSGSMNSCANPVIYFFKQPGIKKAFFKMFNVNRNNEDSSFS